MMKAAFINKHGNIDQIQIGEINIPKINPNEVLINTKYAALNHLDLFVIQGWAGLNLSFPHIIGADGSGVIKDVGSEVSTLYEGDKVLINPGISCGKCEMCLSGKQVFCKYFSIKGENQWGTFANYFKMPEVNVLKIPDNFPLEKAAAAPLTFLTAWRMLKTQANLQSDEIVFIHGASGGVSSAAIQIAKYLGGIVITTTSSPEKVEMAEKLGADYVINYKEMKDYTKYVYVDLTNKHGVDVVIDNIGKATFQTSMQLLRSGGRLITCGATTGSETQIMLNQIFWKHLEIKGSTMANQGEFHNVMRLVLEKRINPIIDKIFPLEHIKDAEKYLKESKQFGKIVLKI
ncbi:MAG: zinc-binding dehydrogenase [Promethearchaeota archaeon]